MRAGSWKLTPYQAWLEGLLQALSLSLGAAFSFHEHCLDRWKSLTSAHPYAMSVQRHELMSQKQLGLWGAMFCLGSPQRIILKADGWKCCAT